MDQELIVCYVNEFTKNLTPVLYQKLVHYTTSKALRLC